MSHTPEDLDVIDFLSYVARANRQSYPYVGLDGNKKTADALQFLADNYALCKAAPELLETLQMVRDNNYIFTLEDIKKIEQVIAKATGEK